ncbi:flagellar hook capping FlgD N-terminal domain-containing protein [Glaciibacter psychrotolerans]|uniref:Flagellar basal-body rod modification protein FlgD n=1 Tax=Glaciibacter psychrotolerans TaxID=670054 RepID=A0A7Z0EBX4_9MICO|nr:flagellar hook capping FlgD N-terminal domain-containing protein [Leifsonia psychrotolerans]NYJ18765.1 flagellar basal-body rod modification protein FlgD [Leifsonia psychrotolerans]
MTVEAVAAGSSTSLYSRPTTDVAKQTLDSEVFMHLLVTQLRNQDPSSPMDTNEMISQTTQLAMMEQMTAMNKTSDENFGLQMRTAAANLIGNTVTYRDADGTEVTGIATSVSFKGAVPLVTIDGVEVPLDVISGITTPKPVPAPVPTP